MGALPVLNQLLGSERCPLVGDSKQERGCPRPGSHLGREIAVTGGSAPLAAPQSDHDLGHRLPLSVTRDRRDLDSRLGPWAASHAARFSPTAPAPKSTSRSAPIG